MAHMAVKSHMHQRHLKMMLVVWPTVEARDLEHDRPLIPNNRRRKASIDHPSSMFQKFQVFCISISIYPCICISVSTSIHIPEEEGPFVKKTSARADTWLKVGCQMGCKFCATGTMPIVGDAPLGLSSTGTAKVPRIIAQGPFSLGHRPL